MQKVRVVVTCKRMVVCDGVALILNSAENLEVVGREGADVLEEAFALQPDLLIYQLCSNDDGDYEVLRKLKELCGWTKLIIFTACPLKRETLKKYLFICDGYLQGPILPGFLLKVVELACYSGYFFFLGSSKDIKPEVKEDVQHALPEHLSSKN